MADEGFTREWLAVQFEAGSAFLFGEGRSCAVVFPRGTLLRIGLGGGDLDELRGIEARIEKFARANGFLRLEIIGRRGWSRVLPGYEEAAVILRKEL
ncbi:MAG: hypothetical protein VX464_11655 [Pseudomonadota bacterium]|nr:hypothetical protein [Pseudomonadota bacterium]